MEEPKKPAVIPYLMLNNAAEAIEFYKKALGAKELARINYPNDEGKIMHACIGIDYSPIFLSDTHPEKCPAPTNSYFYLNVADVDAAFATASKAGMEMISKPEDMFWGDRMGTLKDKFGITWSLATNKQNLSLDEIKQAAANMSRAA